MHPYVFEPVITLRVGLYNQPRRYADQEAAIGETLGDAKQEGVREVQIGNAQAWYYPEDRTIVLWECFLWNFVRDHTLTKDLNMKQLWLGFEDVAAASPSPSGLILTHILQMEVEGRL